MAQKIAVAIIHGIGKQKANFADKFIAGLRKHFSQASGQIDSSDVVIEPVHWAPVVQGREDSLWRRLRHSGKMDFKLLRKFMIYFVADAIAYTGTPTSRLIYDQIHCEVAKVLNSLADRAGAEAPLCIISHSLGSVIASNYLYDLQQKKSMRPAVKKTVGKSALAKGDTLGLFYTLGSPLAIWGLPYYDPDPEGSFGAPVEVPAKKLLKSYPGIEGKWINFFDEDDVIGYPLKRLNRAYAKAVTEDRQVNVGNWLTSWNMASHTGYFKDKDVIKPIAEGLARMWGHVNGR